MINELWSSILKEVKNGIGLLALIVLVVGTILFAVAQSTPNDANYRGLYPILSFALLALIVVAVILERVLQNGKREKGSIDLESVLAKFGATGDRNLAGALKRIGDGFSKILQVDNDEFRSEIGRRVNQFVADVDTWKNGQLFMGPDDSKDFLLNLNLLRLFQNA